MCNVPQSIPSGAAQYTVQVSEQTSSKIRSEYNLDTVVLASLCGRLPDQVNEENKGNLCVNNPEIYMQSRSFPSRNPKLL